MTNDLSVGRSGRPIRQHIGEDSFGGDDDQANSAAGGGKPAVSTPVVPQDKIIQSREGLRVSPATLDEGPECGQMEQAWQT